MKTKTQRYNDYQRKLSAKNGKHRLGKSARAFADCFGITRKKLMEEFKKRDTETLHWLNEGSNP